MPNDRKLIIAIDGYASSGKSTLAKALADELGYVFIDTGAMYRGVAYFVSIHGLYTKNSIHENELIKRLDEIDLLFGAPNAENDRPLLLNGIDISKNIRSTKISELVSLIAVIPEVRRKLVDLQQKMGAQGGIVMDGRDIGTVVFPNADLKIFVTADLEIRAHRRHFEMLKSSPDISLEYVKSNLASRDEIDTKRTTSPLKQAEDAVLFNTDLLTRETQLEKALALVRELLAK